MIAVKWISLIGVLAVMLAAPVSAQDQDRPEPPHGARMHCPPSMMPPGGAGPMFPAMPAQNNADLTEILQQVGVNSDATKKILDINRDFSKAFNEKIIEVQREDLNLRSELLKDHPDLNTIKDIVTRKSKVFSEIEFAQIKRDLDIKGLLSPDQFDKWKSITMQKMHDRFGDSHKHQKP